MRSPEELKKADQIALLEVCQKFTDTGDFNEIFTYPNCGWDLVEQGLATEDKKITKAGQAVLWFLGKGSDPTNSKAAIEFNLDSKDDEREENEKKRINKTSS